MRRGSRSEGGEWLVRGGYGVSGFAIDKVQRVLSAAHTLTARMALGVAGAWAGGASMAGEGKVRAGKEREPEPREEAYAAEGVRPPQNSRNPLPKLPPEFSPELSGEVDPQERPAGHGICAKREAVTRGRRKG
jgi:hypothetical protein